MRDTLRFLPAAVGVATFASACASLLSCGPSELFLGSFHPPLVSSDASADGALPATVDGGAPVQQDAMCPTVLEDAGAMAAPFRDPACRACAMSACCSSVAACFLDETDDAGAHCARQAACIGACRAALSADAGSLQDASVDAGVTDCELACAYLGTSTRYVELETCVADACSCPVF